MLDKRPTKQPTPHFESYTIMALNSRAEQLELAAAFRAGNAIVDLEGLPFSKETEDVQKKIIRGELTFEQAIEMRVQSLKQRGP